LIASAIAYDLLIPKLPPPNGSDIEYDWSIRKRKQPGFLRLISAVYISFSYNLTAVQPDKVVCNGFGQYALYHNVTRNDESNGHIQALVDEYRTTSARSQGVIVTTRWTLPARTAMPVVSARLLRRSTISYGVTGAR
jgi:hypothetical protein